MPQPSLGQYKVLVRNNVAGHQARSFIIRLCPSLVHACVAIVVALTDIRQSQTLLLLYTSSMVYRVIHAQDDIILALTVAKHVHNCNVEAAIYNVLSVSYSDWSKISVWRDISHTS